MRGAILAAVLVLTACGAAPALQPQSIARPTATTPSPPLAMPTPSSSPTPTPSKTGLIACAASQLELSVVSTQGAAGHIFANLALANSSATPCTLDGFPNAQLFNASGNSVTTRVVDRGGELSSSPAPSEFVLAPTRRASFTASWGDVNVGTEICKSASTIEIGLPGSAVSVHLRVTRLYIQICNAGELDVSALSNSPA